MERFCLSQAKAVISSALETKDILADSCAKHRFLMSETHPTSLWIFTDSNSPEYYRTKCTMELKIISHYGKVTDLEKIKYSIFQREGFLYSEL